MGAIFIFLSFDSNQRISVTRLDDVPTDNSKSYKRLFKSWTVIFVITIDTKIPRRALTLYNINANLLRYCLRTTRLQSQLKRYRKWRQSENHCESFYHFLLEITHYDMHYFNSVKIYLIKILPIYFSNYRLLNHLYLGLLFILISFLCSLNNCKACYASHHHSCH